MLFSLANAAFVAGLCRPALAGLATGVSPVHPPSSSSLRGLNRSAIEDADRGLQYALSQAAATIGRGARRLDEIEARLRVPAATLPVDELGRLGPRGVRFLIQHFFSQEHGWTLVGLEPHGYRTDASQVYDVSILKEKVPMIATLLSENSDAAMSLRDVTQLTAILERVIDEEHRDVLWVSYELNGFDPAALLNDAQLSEVMFTYLLLFEMGFRVAHGMDRQSHEEYKREALSPQGQEVFGSIIELQTSVMATSLWRHRQMLNPFVTERYSFEDVSGFVAALMSAYPALLNQECGGMKSHLQSMTVPGTGAVPLGKFYAERGNGNLEYSFTENLEYLRAIGSVDEHDNVRIANYMSGPTNCMQTSSFFSVCCMNECDMLHTQLMSMIQAPTATPELILGAIENVTWHLSDEPLVQDAASKLELVASHHDGMVPLHSRLFAQWLHYIFPNECPFPHVAQANALSVQSWQGGSAIASNDAIDAAIEERGLEAPANMAPTPYWDDASEEVLPLLEPQHEGSLRTVARCTIIAFMAGAILRYALSGFVIARRAYYHLPLVECRGSKHHLV